MRMLSGLLVSPGLVVALPGGGSSPRAAQILPLLLANSSLPPPTKPCHVLVEELQPLTSLQAGHAEVWVSTNAKSAAVDAPHVFLMKVLMEVGCSSGEHYDMTVLCRVLWRNNAASYGSSGLLQYMENKQSDHTEEERSGISEGLARRCSVPSATIYFKIVWWDLRALSFWWDLASL